MNTYTWALLAVFVSSATPITLLLMREVIPPLLRLDLQYPGIRSQQGDAAGLGNEAVPGATGGIGDGLIVCEQPMREEALLEIEPHALDRV